MPQSTTTPFRQIRAKCDRIAATPANPRSNSDDDDGEDLVTVYQAYNPAIVEAACAAQRLDASPRFRLTRMTWVKPSWCWMMYRAGYSHKDENQARILALRMRKRDFWALLRMAELTTHDTTPLTSSVVPAAVTATQAGGDDDDDGKEERAKKVEDAPHSGDPSGKSEKVKVQWDPERNARIEKLGHRSIQIGIPAALAARWVAEWIVDITDVTSAAQELKRVIDAEPGITDAELVERELCPVEVEVVVPEDLREILRMDL
ncbi:DUF4291 family protein [Microdochium nivale]|nr:DUF4291 family protein [Microdochium nivale]